MNPFATDAALAAHRRAAPGRVYIHLVDDADREPAPPRFVSLPVTDGRRPDPVNWQAEADALCMSVDVLRYQRPESHDEQRARLDAWRQQAAKLRVSYEVLRRRHNRRICRVRTRQRQGTA